MADFNGRVARLDSLATARLGGTAWELDGVAVTAVYNARHKPVNFGDERYKNVDMTGVGINSTGPALSLPTATVPYDFGRDSEAYRVADGATFRVVSVEDDNGITYVRLRRETR